MSVPLIYYRPLISAPFSFLSLSLSLFLFSVQNSRERERERERERGQRPHIRVTHSLLCKVNMKWVIYEFLLPPSRCYDVEWLEAHFTHSSLSPLKICRANDEQKLTGHWMSVMSRVSYEIYCNLFSFSGRIILFFFFFSSWSMLNGGKEPSKVSFDEQGIHD